MYFIPVTMETWTLASTSDSEALFQESASECTKNTTGKCIDITHGFIAIEALY